MFNSMLFDVILGAIAVYVLIAAIRGKGKLYDTQFIKDGKEKEYCKKVRVVYFILSIVMLSNFGVNLINDLTNQGYQTPITLSKQVISILNYVYLGLIMILLVFLIVLSSKYTDKEKKKNFVPGGSKEQDPRQKGHTLPVSAFEFDDEPKKVEAKKPATKTAAAKKVPVKKATTDTKKTTAKKTTAKKTVVKE